MTPIFPCRTLNFIDISIRLLLLLLLQIKWSSSFAGSSLCSNQPKCRPSRNFWVWNSIPTVQRNASCPATTHSSNTISELQGLKLDARASARTASAGMATIPDLYSVCHCGTRVQDVSNIQRSKKDKRKHHWHYSVITMVYESAGVCLFFLSIGCNGVTRRCSLFWGHTEGSTVLIWETLSEQGKASWLEEASTMHDWVVCASQQKGWMKSARFNSAAKLFLQVWCFFVVLPHS